MRCFLAIVPPKDVIQQLISYHQQFELGQYFKQTKSASFHITFEFYSDLALDLSKKVSDQLGSEISKIDSFEICTGEYTTFPNRVRSKVLVLKTVKSKSGYLLKNAITKINENYLINVKDKRFTPHLSIGRWSKPFQLDKSVLNNMNKDKKPHSFYAQELVLFKSQLSPAGATFTKLGSFSFNNES